MKPQYATTDLQVVGGLSSKKFDVHEGSEAHLFRILRDYLYSNKILAVLREYGSNAWDAHRDAGKPDLPIKISLPTDLECTLVIRDWGPGLSEEDVYGTYVRYGASTKRNENNAVGMFGIGSKSAFAYSDSFTITSWHGGTKSIYAASLDETDCGIVTKLFEEDCDPSETGIEIQVPVDPKDIRAFKDEAERLFPYFRPQPSINLKLQEPVRDEKRGGFIRKYSVRGLPNWSAIMGCVPYAMDLRMVKAELQEAQMWDLLDKLYGGIYFEIGEVNITASREQLEYTEKTKAAIVARVQDLYSDLVKDLEVLAADESISGWDKRRQMKEQIHLFGVQPTKELARWGEKWVALYSTATEVVPGSKTLIRPHAPKSFVLKKAEYQKRRSKYRQVHMIEWSTISISEDSILVLRDDVSKPLNGYSLTDPNVRIVEPTEGHSLKEAEEELQLLLKGAGLDGIPMQYLSERTYVPAYEHGHVPVEKNPKHSASYFLLDPATLTRRRSPLSVHWTVTDEQPTADDVVIILRRFVAVDTDLYHAYTSVQEALTLLHGKDVMPRIFGVKTTDRKPVHYRDLPGLRFEEWVNSAFQKGLSTDAPVNQFRQATAWAQSPGLDPRAMESEFGPEHPLTVYAFARQRAEQFLHRISKNKREKFKNLVNRLEGYDAFHDNEALLDAHQALRDIFALYPIFAPNQKGYLYWLSLEPVERRAPWLEYIHLKDEKRAQLHVRPHHQTSDDAESDQHQHDPEWEALLDQEG